MRSGKIAEERCMDVHEKVNWGHAICQEDKKDEGAAALSLLPSLTSDNNGYLLSVLQVEFLGCNNLCSRCRDVTSGLLHHAKGHSEFIQYICLDVCGNCCALTTG